MADFQPSDSLPPERTPFEDEEEIVRFAMQEFTQMTTWRNTFAAQWEEVAALIAPNFVNTFFYGSSNYPGQKKTQQQIDATGMMALHRFGAIMDSLLTPRNQFWHALTAEDDDLKKDRDTRLWYEEVCRRLFHLRYAPIANFASQNQQNYQGLGAFGTGGMFVDQAVDEAGNALQAIRYKAIPLGELFIRENHQGLIDGFNRWFRLDARQCLTMFGPERFPSELRAALDAQSSNKFDFLHRVTPNDEYTPGRLDRKGKRFAAQYICIQGKSLMRVGGYHSMPLAASRYDQAPGEIYGRSPAMMVLPALKTLNAQKATFLKQGHRAADPVLLTADDGIIDMSLRPGAINKGGVTADGHALVHALPTGSIQISKEMMAEEKSLINDAFLVSLFQILTESPTMTATEVVERTNEKGILIAPTAGRQQSEYLGTMIHRELDLMAQLRLLPPMPPALRKAKGSYAVEYTSPLARAQRSQEIAGFNRTLENVMEIVNATQDPAILDNFSFDRAVPEIAEIQAVPVKWMATTKELQAKRQQRAEQQQKAAQIQALPAQAAMVKAQAVQGKAAEKNGIAQARGTPMQNLPQGPGGLPPAQGPQPPGGPG